MTFTKTSPDMYREDLTQVGSGYTKKDARPFPIGKNDKIVALMKDGFGENIFTESVALRAKLYICKHLDEKNPEDM